MCLRARGRLAAAREMMDLSVVAMEARRLIPRMADAIDALPDDEREALLGVASA